MSSCFIAHPPAAPSSVLFLLQDGHGLVDAERLEMRRQNQVGERLFRLPLAEDVESFDRHLFRGDLAWAPAQQVHVPKFAKLVVLKPTGQLHRIEPPEMRAVVVAFSH